MWKLLGIGALLTFGCVSGMATPRDAGDSPPENCPSCPRDVLPVALAFSLGLVGGVAAGFALALRRKPRPTREGSDPKSAAPGGSDKETAPTPEQLATVRTRVRAHRTAYVAYLIEIECIRHDLPSRVVQQALDGRTPIKATPVLYLGGEEFGWQRGQRARTVELVLAEEGLTAPSDVTDPTSRADRAVREWAEAEAEAIVSTWVAR